MIQEQLLENEKLFLVKTEMKVLLLTFERFADIFLRDVNNAWNKLCRHNL